MSPPHSVMELFIYVRTGGQRASMVVRLLEEDDADLYKKLATFDAGKALCYREGDRQRLLAIIEAGFGTFAPFNALVRSIFADAVEGREVGQAEFTRARRRSSTLRDIFEPARARRPSQGALSLSGGAGTPVRV